MKEPRSRVRITVDLQPRFHDRLTQLEETVEANSKADLIRDALRIYELLAREVLAGRRICSVDQEGQSKEIMFTAPMPETGGAAPEDRNSS